MTTTAPNRSFYQGPDDVVDQRPLMPWGTFWGDLITLSGKNSAPQANETWTIAVPGTVQNGASYYASEGGVQAVHLTATTDQDDLGNGLAASVGSTIGSSSAGGTLRSRWVPTYNDSTNVLTLVATWPGVVTGIWTVSNGFTDDLGAPNKSVDAASAARVKAGRALVALGSMSGTGGTRIVFQPIADDFTAQVVTHAITAGTGDSFQPILVINGVSYPGASVPFDTNADTTAANIATEIESLAPADVGVLGTSSTNDVIATAEVKGAEFTLQIIASGPTAVAAVGTPVGPSTATSLERAFVGISERGTDVEAISNDNDEGSYGPNEGVRYATRGIGTVEKATAEAWALGDGLWIDVSEADREDSGKFHNVAAAGRIWMSQRTLVVDQGGGSDDTTTGVIRLHMGA